MAQRISLKIYFNIILLSSSTTFFSIISMYLELCYTFLS